MAGTEKQREIRRRRARREKLLKLRKKVAAGADKAEIARKVRRMTPGAHVVLASMGIEES